MRAGLRSARRAKPAETLTWPSHTLTLSGMAASVRDGHRRAHLERRARRSLKLLFWLETVIFGEDG